MDRSMLHVWHPEGRQIPIYYRSLLISDTRSGINWTPGGGSHVLSIALQFPSEVRIWSASLTVLIVERVIKLIVCKFNSNQCFIKSKTWSSSNGYWTCHPLTYAFPIIIIKPVNSNPKWTCFPNCSQLWAREEEHNPTFWPFVLLSIDMIQFLCWFE